MKILFLFCLAVVAVAKAGITASVDLPRPEKLEPAKLEEILKQVDRAGVSFYLLPLKVAHDGLSYPVPGIGASILTDDKEWLAEFSAFLKAVDGKPGLMTPAIVTPLVGVTLYHGDKFLFDMYWLGDRTIVMHADGRAFELDVGLEVLPKYQAICAKKKPSDGIQQTPKPMQMKVPLPNIDPKSLEIKSPGQPQIPTQPPGPRG